jgi:hypothetical protein
LITAPVALLEFHQMQALQMFPESEANQRRSIYFLAPGCDVSGLQEFGVQNDLYGFQCGNLSTVYSTVKFC